jgi:hypothetical protein
MEPLSLKTRRIFSIISFIVFIIVLFVAALYASGYRLDKTFSLFPTGGIYVSVPRGEVSLFLDGVEVGKSGILTKSFFIDDLDPGEYELYASSTSYHSWTKTVTVEPKVVTDVSAMLVPKELSTIALVLATSTSGMIGTTTRALSKEDYAALPNLFARFATTTRYEDGGYELSTKDGVIHLVWVRSSESVPSGFCEQPSVCVTSFTLPGDHGLVAAAAFYDGGVVYQTRSGIYLIEADLRTPRMSYPLFEKAGSSFAIDRGRLLIQDGKKYYEITGW